MRRKITIFESEGSDCPYLPDRTWKTHLFLEDEFPEELYEVLLGQGFRRSGRQFYQNRCPGCEECRQLRIPVLGFAASRSQLRAAGKNRDVEISIGPAEFRKDVFELYARYCGYKHSREEASEESFRRFLCDSPLDTRLMEYRIDGRLAGAGWLDFLPRGLSSVYFAFEPDFASRSLGTFSVLKEIDLARGLGLDWHYLGFIVEGSPKMAYKAAFRPHQRLEGGRWRDYP